MKQSRKNSRRYIYINCLLDLGKSDIVLKICDDALKGHPDDKTILVVKHLPADQI